MKSIHVDMLYFAKLAELTGAATVLRNLLHGFEQHPQIVLRAWARDVSASQTMNTPPSQHTNPSNSTRTYLSQVIFTLKQLARTLLESLAKYSAVMALLLVWLTYFGGARKVTRHYQGNGHCLLFHEIFTPTAFRRQHPSHWHRQHKILVLHCDGDPLKMLFGYYPKLAQSRLTHTFFQRLLEQLFNEVNTIVLLGQRSRQRFHALFPHYAHKTHVIPNGLTNHVSPDVSIKQPQTNLTRFITVGTVGLRKGHDLLLAAVACMSAAERACFEIHIVGDGHIRAALQAQCEQAQWHNIVFHGAQNDVWPLLASSDVFILASRDEGLPMAIIEAMCMGLPIIATDVGDCADLVQNDNGWLIPADAKAIANAMRQAITANDLAKRGAASQTHYRQHYTLSAMCDAYAALFNAVPPPQSGSPC